MFSIKKTVAISVLGTSVTPIVIPNLTGTTVATTSVAAMIEYMSKADPEQEPQKFSYIQNLTQNFRINELLNSGTVTAQSFNLTPTVSGQVYLCGSGFYLRNRERKGRYTFQPSMLSVAGAASAAMAAATMSAPMTSTTTSLAAQNILGADEIFYCIVLASNDPFTNTTGAGNYYNSLVTLGGWINEDEMV